MKRIFSIFILVIFCLSQFSGYGAVLPYMPPAGQMIMPTEKPYDLPYIVGMRFSSDNIFNFTFFLNRGNVPAKEDILRSEVDKVGKYFLAALTIPEKDLWVNLSPYEQDRIITPELSRTDLGKDLLGEDYVLKQLASSLTYPDSESGKKYWDEINSTPLAALGGSSTTTSHGALRAGAQSSFTKVWIVPGTIKMKEASDRVVITEATLKVLTEEDYLACRQAGLATQQNFKSQISNYKLTNGNQNLKSEICNLQSDAKASAAMRNIIVPLIEKEVNTGKHFAHLRQVYRSIILAGWFKKKLKDTILNQVYFNQKKIKGAENNDPTLKDKIYNEYVKAFNQGVYNVIKKESAAPYGGNSTTASSRASALIWPSLIKITRRQYFSGGMDLDKTFETEQCDLASAGVVDGAADQLGGMQARMRMASVQKPVEPNDRLYAGEAGGHENVDKGVDRAWGAAAARLVKPTGPVDRAVKKYGMVVLGETLLGQRDDIYNEVRAAVARLPQKGADREREFGSLLGHFRNEVEWQQKYIARLNPRFDSDDIRAENLELEALNYVVAILPGLETELRVPHGAQASFPFDRFAQVVEKQPTPVPQPAEVTGSSTKQFSLPFPEAQKAASAGENRDMSATSDWISGLLGDWRKNRDKVLISPSGKGIRNVIASAPEGFPNVLSTKPNLVKAIRYAHTHFGGPLPQAWLTQKEGFWYLAKGVDPADAGVAKELARVKQKVDYIYAAAEKEGMPPGVAEQFAQWMCDRMHAGESGEGLEGSSQEAVEAMEKVWGAGLREKTTDAIDGAVKAYGEFNPRKSLSDREDAIDEAVQVVVARLPQGANDRKREMGYLLARYRGAVEASEKFIARLRRENRGSNGQDIFAEEADKAALQRVVNGLERLASMPLAPAPQGADGGFDFAKTNTNTQVEPISGGLKLSAPKAAAYLADGKLAGFKLSILALRY
jgi:hypothetical protein